jgi:hypothetical protein
MKKQRCLIMALALAGVMLLAGPGLAQKQGGGPGGGPGNQVCTGGPGGVCTINPATPAKQNGPGPGAGKAQKRQGMRGARGGAQSNQTDTQTKAPEAGQ